jgi:hypothetical protein
VRIKVEGGASTNEGYGMARFKPIEASPRLLPVDLTRQLLPGTFEHALNRLLDREIDFSCFDARFCNDETGATAYPPAMLLKVVLFAYSRGIVWRNVRTRGPDARECDAELLDDVISAQQDGRRQNKTELLGRLQIEH